jgi:hypothetical protein
MEGQLGAHVPLRRVDAKSRVVLPEGFAGQTVIVDEVNDCEVRIRIAKAPRPRPSLRILLSGVTKNNLHGEIGFGLPRGTEVL